ncbi:MAG: hypothetical protein MH252_05110 [Thermosynechococcaceae cyanobacterium MS004]|nr:hypothetical protein [Thermosynechococcaceae cyanobacterium MS004]
MSESQPAPTPEVDAPKTSESKPKPILRSKEEREKARESGGQPNREKPRVGAKSEGVSGGGSGNKSGGRPNDKRRGRQDREEAPARSNPALARGPKPTIAKPAPEPEEVAVEETAAEETAIEEASDAAETEASGTEAE